MTIDGLLVAVVAQRLACAVACVAAYHDLGVGGLLGAVLVVLPINCSADQEETHRDAAAGPLSRSLPGIL